MVNNNYPVDIPKTYTVSYFDEREWNKDLTLEEIKQQQEIADLQNQLGEFEKVYGPCSDSKCHGSNACLSGEYFYPLRVPCPTERCRGKLGGQGQPIKYVSNAEKQQAYRERKKV